MRNQRRGRRQQVIGRAGGENEQSDIEPMPFGARESVGARPGGQI
jgi:hypothetical protein